VILSSQISGSHVVEKCLKLSLDGLCGSGLFNVGQTLASGNLLEIDMGTM
jgi:hypothetical protein